jgi:hypothetical protein
MRLARRSASHGDRLRRAPRWRGVSRNWPSNHVMTRPMRPAPPRSGPGCSSRARSGCATYRRSCAWASSRSSPGWQVMCWALECSER